MSRGRRVGGSGWAGLHGSIIGLGKTPSSKKGIKLGKKPKIKRSVPGFSGHMTLQEALHAGLSRKQWQQQANKHVEKIEKEILLAKENLDKLKKELKMAERARQAAFSTEIKLSKTRSGSAPAEASLKFETSEVEHERG